MRLFAMTLIVLSSCAVEASQGHTEPIPTIPAATTTTTTAVTTTTTTTTVPKFEPDPEALCPEWHEVALKAGWEEEDLDRLDFVLWRESRCLPEAFNAQDPNGGSRGIAQINQFWCRPNRYNPSGWLQAQGLLRDCTDLHDPVINLTAALAIYKYAKDRGCGWSPWSTRNTRWC